MDPTRFDDLTRALAGPGSRRSLLTTMGASLAAFVGTALGRSPVEAAPFKACKIGCSSFNRQAKVACEKACRECAGNIDAVCADEGPFGPVGFTCCPEGTFCVGDGVCCAEGTEPCFGPGGVTCCGEGAVCDLSGTCCVPTPTAELTEGDPAFTACDGPTTFYDVYPVEHLGGTLAVAQRGRSTCGGTLLDPFLALYAGSFDPNDPCTNLVDQVDDVCSLDAFLSADLDPGTYVVVAASLGQTGSYALEFGASPPC